MAIAGACDRLRGEPAGKVVVWSRAAAQTKVVHLKVEVVPSTPTPVLRIEPAELDFGQLSLGELSPTQIVRVTNAGGGDLQTSVSASPGVAARKRGNVVEVRLYTSAGGEVRGSVTIDSNGGRAAVPVRGMIAQRGPVLVVTPARIRRGDLVGCRRRSASGLVIAEAESGQARGWSCADR